MNDNRRIVCVHPQDYYEDDKDNPAFTLLQAVKVKRGLQFMGRDYITAQLTEAVGLIVHVSWDLVNRKHTYTVWFETIKNVRLPLWAEDLIEV